MQQLPERRSNQMRTEATRAALIAAARDLFVEKTYAETGTPEIVSRAGVTRGALYHHFADKQALFAAVVEAESEAVARSIEVSTPIDLPAVEALVTGGEAFMTAMAEPGRTRLLLLDGPAVLGRRAMDEIDARHGGRTLREGLAMAMRQGAIRRLPIDALAALLSAMFDRAALEIAGGASEADHHAAVRAVILGLRP
ncbi:TetR/AcrR family transcriptional regulator [Aliihoeflea sp. 2WW]|uniref:TetR/AcrR family transcriptional regulator n=1 Tax=Aliihoeflea sp. 2WW TaxID=1381123 RepID=UPI0004652296|nr:TetR/AcrR family transcriptional regulator [Aliihoeflea sp. 2WW]